MSIHDQPGGAIKSIAHSHMGCGGKRWQAKRDAALAYVRIHLKTSLSSQSGVALRLPPHSIKSRKVRRHAPSPSSSIVLNCWVREPILVELGS